MFRFLIIAQFMLAIYVCWLGAGVILATAHSGGEVKASFSSLRSEMELKKTIGAQQISEVEESISEFSRDRNDKHADIAVHLVASGLIQSLLAVSMFFCRHQAAKTDRSNA
jgi:hypothetical protein